MAGSAIVVLRLCRGYRPEFNNSRSTVHPATSMPLTVQVSQKLVRTAMGSAQNNQDSS